MKTIATNDCLELKDLYQTMYNISSALLDDFTDESMFLTLQKREEILQEIAKKKGTEGNSSVYKAIDNETKAVMANVIKLDELMAKKVQNRLDQISVELKGLYSKSRASIAYISYKKI